MMFSVISNSESFSKQPAPVPAFYPVRFLSSALPGNQIWLNKVWAEWKVEGCQTASPLIEMIKARWDDTVTEKRAKEGETAKTDRDLLFPLLHKLIFRLLWCASLTWKDMWTMTDKRGDKCRTICFKRKTYLKSDCSSWNVLLNRNKCPSKQRIFIHVYHKHMFEIQNWRIYL